MHVPRPSCPPRVNVKRTCSNLYFLRSSRGLGGFLESWGGKGPVLCNYNSIHKMEPESFTVFMNIMKRCVPGVPYPLELFVPNRRFRTRTPSCGTSLHLDLEHAILVVWSIVQGPEEVQCTGRGCERTTSVTAGASASQCKRARPRHVRRRTATFPQRGNEIKKNTSATCSLHSKPLTCIQNPPQESLGASCCFWPLRGTQRTTRN